MTSIGYINKAQVQGDSLGTSRSSSFGLGVSVCIVQWIPPSEEDDGLI